MVWVEFVSLQIRATLIKDYANVSVHISHRAIPVAQVAISVDDWAIPQRRASSKPPIDQSSYRTCLSARKNSYAYAV